MTVLDIDQVPGLPVSRHAALRGVGVFLTSDLLRSNREGLAKAIAATIDDIRIWQGFCGLLEIEGLTPDAVRALLVAWLTSLVKASPRSGDHSPQPQAAPCCS